MLISTANGNVDTQSVERAAEWLVQEAVLPTIDGNVSRFLHGDELDFVLDESLVPLAEKEFGCGYDAGELDYACRAIVARLYKEQLFECDACKQMVPHCTVVSEFSCGAEGDFCSKCRNKTCPACYRKDVWIDNETHECLGGCVAQKAVA